MNNPFETIDARLSNIENLLLDLKHTPNNQTPDAEQLLKIQEAAKFLNLSVPTLYGYVHRAEIPCCKRAGRLYFYKHELMDWLKAGRKKTVTELALEADAYLSNQKKRGKGHE